MTVLIASKRAAETSLLGHKLEYGRITSDANMMETAEKNKEKQIKVIQNTILRAGENSSSRKTI